MKIIIEIKSGKTRQEIKFPCGEGYLEAVLKSVGAPNMHPPKLYVEKVLNPKGLHMLAGRYANLDEINYLAKYMDGQIPEEHDKLYAIAAYEGITEVKDLINLAFNPGCYTLIQNLKNMKEVGRTHELTKRGGMTREEAEKTDFEKIGKDLLSSGKGVMTDYGILFENEENELKEVYDGQVFPPYLYDGDKLLSVEINYKGKSENVYLPDEEYAITKALNRLKAPSSEACSYQIDYFNIENSEWEARIEKYVEEKAIYAVNELADKLNVEDIDYEKLELLIKHMGDGSAETLISLVEHVDDFEYIEGATDYKKVGKSALAEHCINELPMEAEEYIDYESYGKHIEKEYNGKFIDGGFIYIPSGETMEEIMNAGNEPDYGEIK